MEQVLAGTRVLDLSRYIAGPWCACILGDMGADVIRIEAPGGAEDREQGPQTATGDNLRFLMIARNKKGITLNLEHPQGKALFHEMVKQADFVVENYSPPVKEKLGLTYDALKKLNPTIILVTVSAFGSNGPYRHRLGFDHIAQAESGSMSFTGFPDTPHTRAQTAWVDMSTALHSALGAVLAYAHRLKTGEGQMVETALLDTAVSYVSFPGVAAEYEVLGQVRPKLGNAGYYSFSDTFQAKDGMVILAALSGPLWKRFAEAIGHPELVDDPRLQDDTSRWFNRDLIYPLVQQWVAERTVQEVFEVLGKARVACGRVQTVSQMVADPQVAARELFQELNVPGIGPVRHPRVAIRLSKTPGQINSPAPKVGEHNDEVYSSLLHLSPAEISHLREQGII